MENEKDSVQAAEMSLDDVLSSIKKMVVDEEPPVLELTEVISVAEGSESPTSAASSKNNDMSAFLRLIQQEGVPSEGSQSHKTIAESEVLYDDIEIDSGNKVICDLVIKAMKPLIKDWVQKNLPQVVKSVVEEEVKKFLYKK